MIRLTDLALRKRTVTIAAALLTVLGGIWAAVNLNVELLPNVEIPLATVLVVYPGADTQSVLDEVTIPVEAAVSGIRGLKNINSTVESSVSVTIAEFEFGTNMKDVLAAINQNLAGIQLPEGAMSPKVNDFDLNSLPILRLSLSGEAEVRQLGEIAESVIKPRVEAIDGVRGVEVVGKPTKQVLVLLDSEKMAQERIDIAQVAGVLQANNVLLPSGDIPDNDRSLPIRAGFRITSTDQIEELVVRPAITPQIAGIPGIGAPLPGGAAPGGSAPPQAPQVTPGPGMVGGTYSVQAGDTLWDIATREYGDGSRSQAILEANRDLISSPEMIQPGMELRMPPVGQVTPQSYSPDMSASLPAAPDSAPGEALRIRDIATVQIVDAENAAISRTNGRLSIGLLIYRTPGANTVKVATAVKKAIDEVLPTGQAVEITIVEDSSQQIEQSIDDLTHEAILGGVFAVLVIYLFLTNAQTTVVSAASIPLSILITFISLKATGMSLNMMTLGGMAVAVGRVVDDTVVVLENIFRHRRQGEELNEAVRAGVREVAAAVTASTLTTVGVFLPLAFIGGLVGEIFRPFALTTTFALLASLLVAMTVIPALATLLGARRAKRKPGDSLLQKLYTPAIRWSLRRKRVIVGIAVFMLIASFGALPFIGTTFLPQSSEKTLAVRVELPPGTDKEATLAVAQDVEGVIGDMEGVEVYQTNVGNTGSLLSAAGFGAGNAATADIYVRLSDKSDVQRTAARMREALESLARSATITVSSINADGVGSSKIEVILSGADHAALKRAAGDVVEALGGIDGLTNLQSDAGTAKPEISVAVDPEKAMQHGTTAAQVAMKVREMIVGQVATTVSLDSQNLDVLVRVRPEDIDSIEKLKKLAVGTADAVPLSEIASVQLSEGPVRLTRRDQKTAVTITGSITRANTGAVNTAVAEAIDATNLPGGVDVTLGGVVEQQTEGFASMGLALIAAVALVYLIMMATMGSILDPLVILVTLPLASIGALLSLLVTGRSLGMAAMIGMLMLIGIVVTNAIVLLDLVRRLRDRGLGVEDALVEAGRTRIRPILMTAGATVLALTPLALGFSEGSIITTEMATVVVGGLTTSTLLTLVVVPVVYSVVERMRSGPGHERSPKER